MSEERDGDTRSERREGKRRRRREMGVSGKGFVNAIRNAILKRRQEGDTGKGKKRRR